MMFEPTTKPETGVNENKSAPNDKGERIQLSFKQITHSIFSINQKTHWLPFVFGLKQLEFRISCLLTKKNVIFIYFHDQDQLTW